jgi:hypothetical protein
MTVEFSFKLDRSAAYGDLEPGTEWRDGDLRYALFHGTVDLWVDGIDFAITSSIPLLDFAADQLFLLNALETSAYQEVAAFSNWRRPSPIWEAR